MAQPQAQLYHGNFGRGDGQHHRDRASQVNTHKNLDACLGNRQ